MLAIITIIACAFIAALLALIVVGARLSARYEEEKRIKTRKQQTRGILRQRTNFFVPLYERLDYLKTYGSHFHVDVMIYAIYKTRLCALMEIEKRELPDSEAQAKIGYFELLMYCSLEEWIEKQAPAFKNPMEIIESRVNAYDRVLTESNLPNPLTMLRLTDTFCWFLKNGWVKNENGKNSRVPNKSFDPQQVKWGEERSHENVIDEIEFTFLHHATLELPKFIDSICREDKEKVRYQRKN